MGLKRKTMLKFTTISDKKRLAAALRRYTDLNLYHIGDLDEFFWPHTRWHAAVQDDEIKAITLLYTAVTPPVLLAILNDNQPEMHALLEDLIPQLPAEVYTHLSPGLEDMFRDRYHLHPHGLHYKMALTAPTAPAQFAAPDAFLLTEDDLPRINRLYDSAYPDNAFDPRMLQTGQCLGLEDDSGELTCIVGIHVYSPTYRVAALGNITTRPDMRGRGLATGLTAALCQQMLQTVDTIGLNVLAGNPAAIKVYRKIGFEVIGEYGEWMMNGKALAG